MPSRSRSHVHSSKRVGESSKSQSRSQAPSQPGSVATEEDVRDVAEMLKEITTEAQKASDNEDSDVELNDGEQTRAKIQRNNALQRKMLAVGKLIGEQGNTAQIVQDARLIESVNHRTLKPIRSIRVSSCIWHSAGFSKRLRKQLAAQFAEDEEMEEGQESLPVKGEYFLAFTNEFATSVTPGLAPNLAVVHGANKDAVVKPKPVKEPAKKQIPTQKSKPGPNDKPVNLAKVKPAEMDAAADPTLERVNKLFAAIIAMFDPKKTVDVMPLLMHPRSFQKTVENFFCFSFLLKDGKVRMFLDEHNLPVCTPVEVHTGDVDEDGNPIMRSLPDPTEHRGAQDKFQTIMMNLNESNWKKYLDVTRIGQQYDDQEDDDAPDSGMEE